MSKRSAKSQASSARAAAGAFSSGFGAAASPAFGTSSSQLSYVTEPPALAAVSDPNVVVYLRNLSKKDSTTKAKALEDLAAHISSLQEPIEDGLLEAWIKMYPRTSIDNSKSVRQLAHSLHGQIALSAGKRIAKHMPKAVGAWLSGLYDTDRSVVEATQSSLRQVFNSPQKIQNIRRAYQQPILAYCRDAIDKESPSTLSDERTVSKDDADAKYSRVISACISLLGSLLSNLQAEDLAKLTSEYESLLGDRKLWDFASHADPSIRRALHRFLKICVGKQPSSINTNLDSISKSYLAVALHSDQIGSAYDFLDALTVLTSAFPSVWMEHYKSKTTVERRLRQFLKKGSQFGPRDFWFRLVDLFRVLPAEIIPQNGADAAESISSLHGGIIRKDESRLNLEAAHIAYLDIVKIVTARLPEDDQRKISTELVWPLISQYLRPTTDTSEWAIPPNSGGLLRSALALESTQSVLEERWPVLVQSFINDIKTSAPEQSKDYERSQEALLKSASRLAVIQRAGLAANASALRSTFVEASASIVSEAINVIKNRNGKPYGAAGVIAELLTRNKELIFAEESTRNNLEEFARENVPALILSRSSGQLVDVLYSLSDSPFFKDAWAAALKTALAADSSPTKTVALEALLTSSKIPSSFDLAATDDALQQYVQISVRSALEGSVEWDSFGRVLQSPSKIMSEATTDQVLATMTQSLSLADQAPYALQGFRQIARSNPSLLKTFISTPSGSSLLQGLLLASESSNEELAQEATAVNASIQTLLAADSGPKQSIFEVIQRGLRDASTTSVSVETLVDLAKQLVQSSGEPSINNGVYPNTDDWDSALSPFLSKIPNTSLAITNPLAGGVYLIDDSGAGIKPANISRDTDGYSPAYRIAQYVLKLFKHSDIFQIDNLPNENRLHFLRNMALTIQLADDNLGLAGANDLWAAYNAEVEAEAMSFISDARDFVTQEVKRQGASWTDPKADSTLLAWATILLAKIEPSTSPKAFYTARAYGALVSEAIESLGWNKSHTAEVQELLKTIRRSKEIFPLLGILHAFNEILAASKSCERMCNELVADLTGIDVVNKPEEALRQLVFLNILLYNQDDITTSIAKQRLIFLVKHAVPWLQDDDVSLPIRSELARALSSLLPLMSDIYGEHWKEIVDALTDSWKKTTELQENESKRHSTIPYIHASLKLYAQLWSLTQIEEPNDDLLDVWTETEADVAEGLINLLKHSQHFPDEFHQPLKIVNDVLARQISRVPLKHLESTEELFPLLYVESQPVQQTAFDILHKQIPAAQEQISIDAALEKTTARLPEELLSLILEAPTMAALGDANFERNIPLSLRGYLLSWLLVFDHLEHASFRVKNDYVEHIKEGEYLPGLLNFAFDFLGHAHNKPVDVSKLDITTYTPDLEPPRRDTQWILAHLYFLSLCHVPSITKAWWIDCKSRPIVVTLEPWTEKHVSPPVINATLQAVSSWADSQSTSDPNSPFTVKVSSRAREITSSYLVDEQTMSMRITLPPAFPLSNPRIESLNRVAVNEQKWQSWLRTSLGAITIFNGSLIDALTTFKRNVDGAMKGQTECAICYSIVGSDKRLPDKRCQTCKNLFHGGCLFKWFKTSGSSSCPLCRNPFNYG